MSGLWNDFNSAQSNSNVIPKGTLAKVRLTIRPGGFDDPSQGWTGGFAKRATTGAVYLDAEYTVRRRALCAPQDLVADRPLQPEGSGLGQHGPRPDPRHPELGARDFRQGQLARSAGPPPHQRVRRSRRARNSWPGSTSARTPTATTRTRCGARSRPITATMPPLMGTVACRSAPPPPQGYAPQQTATATRPSQPASAPGDAGRPSWAQ